MISDLDELERRVKQRASPATNFYPIYEDELRDLIALAKAGRELRRISGVMPMALTGSGLLSLSMEYQRALDAYDRKERGE